MWITLLFALIDHPAILRQLQEHALTFCKEFLANAGGKQAGFMQAIFLDRAQCRSFVSLLAGIYL